MSEERCKFEVITYYAVREEPDYIVVVFYGRSGFLRGVKLVDRDFAEMENELEPSVDKNRRLYITSWEEDGFFLLVHDFYPAYYDFSKKFTIAFDIVDRRHSVSYWEAVIDENVTFMIGRKKFKPVHGDISIGEYEIGDEDKFPIY